MTGATEGLRRGPSERILLLLVALPVLAVVGAYLVFTLSNADYTLGCDYLTYDAAARRWLAGAAAYDLSITRTGECGTYQYPPAFLLLILPFTVLPPEAATWAWIALSVACLGLAVALTPVPGVVRLVTFALAGTSWPMLFAIKVGAAGPLLLLVFAIAWRWLDRPLVLGGATAFGALAKLQPGLLVAWMALTGRWRAFAVSAAAGLVVLGIGLLVDRQSWLDFFTVVRTLSASPLELPLNLAPATMALRYLRADAGTAQAIGAAHTVLVLALVVVSARRSAPDASLLVAAVASQVVAPVMWDHYAAVLFLPMAWLLARNHAWALAIGVVLNAMFILWVPVWLYVVLMDATMLAVAWIGRRRAADAGLPAMAVTA